MVCTYCGQPTKVTNSRLQKRNNQVWRRRQCTKCHSVFTTHEAVDLKTTVSVDKNGQTEPFLPDLLYTEVLLALQDRKDCYTASRELTDTIIRQLLVQLESPVLTPVQISKVAVEVLRRFNKRAALRYTVEHPSVQ